MKKLLFAMLLTIAGLAVSGDMLAGCRSGCRTGGCRTVSETCERRPKCCCWVKKAVPAQRHVHVSYSCPKGCELNGQAYDVEHDGFEESAE